MNALEEKLLQRMVSDFETAEPLICSPINMVIPALCLGSTLKSCPPLLPRIPGGRNDTSRRWPGCHSSTVPLPDKLADTTGLPPSPWESVSKFHFTRCGVYAQVACPGSTARWRSIGSAVLSASQRLGVALSTSTPVCVLVSSCVQFSRFRKGL